MKAHSKTVIRLAALQSGLPAKALTDPQRTFAITRPRHRAMWVLRQVRPDLSTTQIGRIFGGRDHTTVLNALARHAERMAADPAERVLTEALVAAVSNPEIRALDMLILGTEERLRLLKAERAHLAVLTGEAA